ncbi:MAG: hypothetical protein Q8R02_12945 [Hyphomonadaceae bacterium]|nr:hypothetical protein [Hyphomonadaceae bacterium]
MNRASKWILTSAALVLAACGGKKEEASAPMTDEQKAAAAASSILGALTGNGGEASPEMKGYVANLTKVADALGTVKDEASARAIGQQLRPVFEDMQKQADALNAMTEEQKGVAAMSMAPELISVQQKIAVAMSNWAMTKPELMEIVGEELEKMPEIE